MPTPVTVADAALLLWPHRRHLTPEERRVLADLLSEGVCAMAGDPARLQGCYARCRLLGLVP